MVGSGRRKESDDCKSPRDLAQEKVDGGDDRLPLPAPSDTINFMSAEDGAHVFRYDPDAVDTETSLPVSKEESASGK